LLKEKDIFLESRVCVWVGEATATRE